MQVFKLMDILIDNSVDAETIVKAVDGPFASTLSRTRSITIIDMYWVLRQISFVARLADDSVPMVDVLVAAYHFVRPRSDRSFILELLASVRDQMPEASRELHEELGDFEILERRIQ